MSATKAVSGTRRAIRERVDGSLVVQVEIDPRFKADFLRLFPDIDAPIALAPLVANFEQREPEEKPKGGALAKLAGMWSSDPEFGAFAIKMAASHNIEATNSADFIRKYCGVESRALIDGDQEATEAFHRIRGEYVKYRTSRGLK